MRLLKCRETAGHLPFVAAAPFYLAHARIASALRWLAASLRAQLTPPTTSAALSLQQKYRGLVLLLPDAPEWATLPTVSAIAEVHGGHELCWSTRKSRRWPRLDHARWRIACQIPGEPSVPERFRSRRSSDGNTSSSSAGPEHWRCDLATYECASCLRLPITLRSRDEGTIRRPPAINGPRPGGFLRRQMAGFCENYNVAVRPADLRGEDAVRRTVALSQDGSEGNYYAVAHSPGRRLEASGRIPYPAPATAAWSLRGVLACRPASTEVFGHGLPQARDLLPLFQARALQIEDKRQFAIENTLFPNPYQLTPFCLVERLARIHLRLQQAATSSIACGGGRRQRKRAP